MLKPILATLAYLRHPDGDRILMIHRNTRPDDLHAGRYNGLGGKIEPGESVTGCLEREIREEAGVRVTGFQLRGTISWPGFGRNGEDWFGFLFLVDTWEGEPLERNTEGTLHWTLQSDLLEGRVPLWPGDRFFLPLLFDPAVSQFHGVMPYRLGKPQSWNCDVLLADGGLRRIVEELR